MTVLYISYMGMTEPLLHSQGLPYLEALARDGFKIHILSFEKKEAFRDGGGAIRTLKVRLGSQGIEWHILRYHKRPPVLSTLFDLLQGFWKASRLIRWKEIRLIHARGTVPAAIGLTLKTLFKLKLLFDVRGLMAEEYVDGGLWKRGGWLYRIASYCEKRCLMQSDGIIFLTHRIYRFFQRSEPSLFADHKRIEVIPSCVDLEQYSGAGEKDTSLKVRLGLNGRFVFVYVGSFGTWYLLDEMLDFFRESRELIPDAYFLILTQTSVPDFPRRLREGGLNPADLFLTFVSPTEVPRYLSLAHAGLFFIRPCFSKLSSSPTKFGEYLASGIPVVINRSIGDTDILVEKEKVGVVVRDFSPKAYRESVKSLLDLIREGGAPLRDRCRKVAERYLSLDMGSERYHQLYSALVDRGESAS